MWGGEANNTTGLRARGSQLYEWLPSVCHRIEGPCLWYDWEAFCRGIEYNIIVAASWEIVKLLQCG